ncbi:acyl-CoA dehydrogenase family protein [Variovorax ginsengisoli]|uniref:Acyl-CoA dehydrogenase family protein n=1 Tax=Variovorax ginsengisoli TaxID=363844 RepID=A0ABT8SFF1_9BURK|nr:acyl-CoA dehydrogenase family protein [Variovorax ginsengisoli]MDN8618485.1 acyl-CoA dehydrogenase family protein [Variovorax ginsengisoli]MDO1537655.1 acyl-CoA dehydrogenase family protein [Variovorax ginsengisoli]
MDFQLNDVQRMMVESARQVGERFGLEYWREHDAKKAFPKEFWLAVCEAGLGGAALPEAYGGSGLGMFELSLIVDTLASTGGGSTVGQLFMINPIFGGVSISRFGSEKMKQEVLPKIISGEINCSMALTEPDAGTNTLELKTFARAEGDGWRLSGRKVWITGVASAQKMLVIARTKKLADSKSRTDGLTMFMIDVEREGLTHTPIDKLGTCTLDSSSVFFDDVRVEPDELIGTLHGGWRELLDVLNTERIVTTSGLVGSGSLAIRLAVEYANDRKVFGDRSISSYQGIQFPLAQGYAEIQAARLLNHKAATNFDQNLPYGSEANAAKLLAAQACSTVTEKAMQAMGGMGYAKEFHLERLWRDCRLFRFAPVSEEMVLNFIANHDLGMPRSY